MDFLRLKLVRLLGLICFLRAPRMYGIHRLNERLIGRRVSVTKIHGAPEAKVGAPSADLKLNSATYCDAPSDGSAEPAPTPRGTRQALLVSKLGAGSPTQGRALVLVQGSPPSRLDPI